MKDDAILLYDKMIKVAVFFFYLAQQFGEIGFAKEKKLVTLFLVTPLPVTPLRG